MLRVSGADSEKFLQGLVTTDVTRLPNFASILNSKGRWLYSFFITKHQDGFLLECGKGEAEGLGELLSRYILGADVAMEPYHTKVWGLWGNVPRLGAQGLGAPGLGLPVFSDPRTTSRITNLARAYGSVATGNADNTDTGNADNTDTGNANTGNTDTDNTDNADTGNSDALDASPLVTKSEKDYIAHCLSLGLVVGEPELQRGKSIILENGFHKQNGINWEKGCYLGQEVMAYIKNRSAPKRTLLLSNSPNPPELDGKIVGEVRAKWGNKSLVLVEVQKAPQLLKQTDLYQPPAWGIA